MRDQRPHSRLVEQEQKKAVRQSLFLVILSVGILVAFLLFGLPLFFSFFLKLFGGDISSQQNQFPPQVPVISAPLAATSSARLPISGFSEANVEVVLVHNGEEIEIMTKDNGAFETDITLKKGANTLNAFARRDEQESQLGKEYSIELDTEKPSLEISEPKDDQTFESRSRQLMTIKGKTDANAKVLINGRAIYPNDKGEFQTTFQLQEGENILKFEAVDKAENKTLKEVKVTYKQ